MLHKNPAPQLTCMVNNGQGNCQNQTQVAVAQCRRERASGQNTSHISSSLCAKQQPGQAPQRRKRQQR